MGVRHTGSSERGGITLPGSVELSAVISSAIYYTVDEGKPGGSVIHGLVVASGLIQLTELMISRERRLSTIIGVHLLVGGLELLPAVPSLLLVEPD